MAKLGIILESETFVFDNAPVDASGEINVGSNKHTESSLNDLANNMSCGNAKFIFDPSDKKIYAHTDETDPELVKNFKDLLANLSNALNVSFSPYTGSLPKPAHSAAVEPKKKQFNVNYDILSVEAEFTPGTKETLKDYLTSLKATIANDKGTLFIPRSSDKKKLVINLLQKDMSDADWDKNYNALKTALRTANDIFSSDSLENEYSESEIARQRIAKMIIAEIENQCSDPKVIADASKLVTSTLKNVATDSSLFNLISKYKNNLSNIQRYVVPAILAKFDYDVKEDRHLHSNLAADKIGSKIETINGVLAGIKKSMIVPSDLTREPNTAIWDKSVIVEFGFPMLNFKSPSLRELASATDKNEKMDLLKHFLYNIAQSGDPLLIDVFMLRNKWRNALFGLQKQFNLLKELSNSSNTDPIIHNYLKVDDVKNLTSGTHKNVECKYIPGTFVSQVESVTSDATPQFEGFLDLFKHKEDFGLSGKGSAPTPEIKKVSIPLKFEFIQQFYTVVDPSTINGISAYMNCVEPTDAFLSESYTSASDSADPDNPIKKKSHEDLTDKASMFRKWIERHDGEPPFYLLMPKQHPKEKLSIHKGSFSDEHDVYMIHTHIQGHHAGYFVDKQLMKELFTYG